MSAGRPRASLDGLQGLLQSAYSTGRLEQAVAERSGVPAPRRISAEELTAAPDVGLSEPSDAQFRLTEQEFRAEVRRAVKIRLREWAEVVDMVLSDKPVPPGHYVLPGVQAAIENAAGEESRRLRATIPPDKPWRKTKTARMPVRVRVPGSDVVLRDRFGGVYDPGTKQPLTREQAQARLTPPEQRVQGWAAERP